MTVQVMVYSSLSMNVNCYILIGWKIPVCFISFDYHNTVGAFALVNRDLEKKMYVQVYKVSKTPLYSVLFEDGSMALLIPGSPVHYSSDSRS